MITNAKIRELKYSIFLGERTIAGLEGDLHEYRAELERLKNELEHEVQLASMGAPSGAASRALKSSGHGRYAGALVIAS